MSWFCFRKCEGIFTNEAASKFQRKLNYVFLVYSADLYIKSSEERRGSVKPHDSVSVAFLWPSSLTGWMIFFGKLNNFHKSITYTPIACLRVMKWLNRIKQQSPRWWCWPLLSVTIGINYDSRKDNWWLGEWTPKCSVVTSETFQQLCAFGGLLSWVINNSFSWLLIFG